jgi:hypothetical protein
MEEEEEEKLLEKEEGKDVGKEVEEKWKECGEKKERKDNETDPLIEAIGEFGRYQLLVCFVGFLFNIPHSWLSLRYDMHCNSFIVGSGIHLETLTEERKNKKVSHKQNFG